MLLLAPVALDETPLVAPTEESTPGPPPAPPVPTPGVVELALLKPLLAVPPVTFEIEDEVEGCEGSALRSTSCTRVNSVALIGSRHSHTRRRPSLATLASLRPNSLGQNPRLLTVPLASVRVEVKIQFCNVECRLDECGFEGRDDDAFLCSDDWSGCLQILIVPSIPPDASTRPSWGGEKARHSTGPSCAFQMTGFWSYTCVEGFRWTMRICESSELVARWVDCGEKMSEVIKSL